MSDHEEQLAELNADAEKLGYQIIPDHTWSYVLARIDGTTNPATHSAVDLDDLREMLDGIKWGREHRTAERFTAEWF